MYAPKDPTNTWVRWLAVGVVLWLLICLAVGARAQPRRNPATQASTIAYLRVLQKVREATARPGNDGPAVAAIIRAGGGNPAQHPEWCGFTQAGNQRAHGLPIPPRGMQGAARAWFVDELKRLLPRTFYYAGRRGVLDSIQVADMLGFAWRPNPTIHHITRCAEVVPGARGRPPRGFYSWGGNEGRWPNAGVHLQFYPATNITAASRWDYK